MYRVCRYVWDELDQSSKYNLELSIVRIHTKNTVDYADTIDIDAIANTDTIDIDAIDCADTVDIDTISNIDTVDNTDYTDIIDTARSHLLESSSFFRPSMSRRLSGTPTPSPY